MSLIEPDESFIPPRIKVSFSRSSQKDGREGFSIDVEEGVEEAEAVRVFDLAADLRKRANQEIDGKLTEQLKESIEQLQEKNK